MAEMAMEVQAEDPMPELDKMKKLRLFTHAEISKIVRCRRKFQYKINKQTKCADDYVRFIQYEKDLLTLVKTRKRKIGLGNQDCEIIMSIAGHINKLFKEAIFQFRDDINLWLSYMKFCKQVKIFSVCMSYMLGGILTLHGHKPSLWKLAATWEYQENKSIENACHILVKGLRHHSESSILYVEAFRLELIYADMKRKQLEPEELELNQAVGKGTTSDLPDACYGPVHAGLLENDEKGPAECSSQQESDHSLMSHGATRNYFGDLVTDCRSAEYVFRTASEKISEASFLISLLNIAKKFSFTEKLQAKIARDLLWNFPDDEITWDTLARRELEGLHFAFDRTNEPEEVSQKKVNRDIYATTDSAIGPILRNEMERIQYIRLRRFFTIYQQGLQRLPTDRMWELYLDALIEINKNGSGLQKFKKLLLCSALQKANDSGHLKEKYYTHWDNVLAS